MECNKDFGVVNQATPAETPDDWWNEMRPCRKRLCPFTIVKMEQSMFLMSKYLEGLYVKSCPFPTWVLVTKSQIEIVEYRDSWTSLWRSRVVFTKKGSAILYKIKPDCSKTILECNAGIKGQTVQFTRYLRMQHHNSRNIPHDHQ